MSLNYTNEASKIFFANYALLGWSFILMRFQTSAWYSSIQAGCHYLCSYLTNGFMWARIPMWSLGILESWLWMSVDGVVRSVGQWAPSYLTCRRDTICALFRSNLLSEVKAPTCQTILTKCLLFIEIQNYMSVHKGLVE